MLDVARRERPSLPDLVKNVRRDLHLLLLRPAVLLGHQGTMASEARPIFAQRDRRHLVPDNQCLVVDVHQAIEHLGPVLGNARLEHKVGVSSNDVNRVVLDATKMADQVDDVAPVDDARRQEPLVSKQESASVGETENDLRIRKQPPWHDAPS